MGSAQNITKRVAIYVWGLALFLGLLEIKQFHQVSTANYVAPHAASNLLNE